MKMKKEKKKLTIVNHCMIARWANGRLVRD